MAVMASETPLSFPEKALPVSAPTSLAAPAHVNGSTTNHYDAPPDKSPVQNGMNNDIGQDAMTDAPAVSKVISAEDASAAPVEHVEGGISGVAAFLPTASTDDVAPIADLPLATSEPAAVQPPTSDVRDEPLPADPAQAIVDQGPLPGEPSPPRQEITSSDKPAQPLVEDKMDTTEDVPEATKVDDTSAGEMLLDRPDEPLDSVEPAASADISDVVSGAPAPSTEIPSQPEAATAGQVRPREEDEDMEPAPKRAKTESGEDEAPISLAAASATPTTTATPTQPQDSITVTPISAPAPAATFSPPKPISLDSNPITTMQTKFLLEQIRKAKKTKSATAYLNPVDPVALKIPTYLEIIKRPMDLRTMEEKLKSGQYSNADALMDDFDTMVMNSITFNGAQHQIAQAGQSLRAYFVKCVSMMPKGDAAKAPEPKAKKPEPAPPKLTRPARAATIVTAKSPTEKPAGFLNEHGVPIIRRDSSAQNDRPKREIHPPKRDLPASSTRPKKKKAQLELKFCETVLAELNKKKHGGYAYAFMHPVDPVALNIPTYHKIIKKPMDFGTVATNLKQGQYASAKEFHADSKLVFNNCYKFNPPTDEVYKMGKLLEEVFDAEWAKKDAWIANNQPPSEPASEEEDEEEEEVEEEEDPNIRRMQEIQAQIAALSAEAMQLTQSGRRASPKASNKTKPAKSGSSKPKAAPKASTASIAKPAKTKPKTKPKKLTMEQKREVSEGIANLDEAKMRKAVQIIRNGVPSLANVQDDELELDIDEIPDDVVYKLWEFVKSSAPKKEQRDPSPDYNDMDDDDDYQQRTSSATGNRRKNKPMKAQEQEERIKQLTEKLQGQGAASGSDVEGIGGHGGETDDEASESSEEE